MLDDLVALACVYEYLFVMESNSTEAVYKEQVVLKKIMQSKLM